LKILTVSKNFSSLPLFSLVHNYIHVWLSEQFLGSHAVTVELKAVIGKPEQAPKGGLLEGFFTIFK
jgi:hypothetical protein